MNRPDLSTPSSVHVMQSPNDSLAMLTFDLSRCVCCASCNRVCLKPRRPGLCFGIPKIPRSKMEPTEVRTLQNHHIKYPTITITITVPIYILILIPIPIPIPVPNPIPNPILIPIPIPIPFTITVTITITITDMHLILVEAVTCA